MRRSIIRLCLLAWHWDSIDVNTEMSSVVFYLGTSWRLVRGGSHVDTNSDNFPECWRTSLRSRRCSLDIRRYLRRYNTRSMDVAEKLRHNSLNYNKRRCSRIVLQWKIYKSANNWKFMFVTRKCAVVIFSMACVFVYVCQSIWVLTFESLDLET